jgi:heptaprenylglyceryl phosphate synthase
VEKSIELERNNFPVLILASTDYEDFNIHMPNYIKTIKSNVSIPVILHFPPRLGYGYPLTVNSDALIYPFLLNSEKPYFVWTSLLETQEILLQNSYVVKFLPEFIYSAALTFGKDDVSYDVMQIKPIDQQSLYLEKILHSIKIMGLDMVYLFSRYDRIDLDTINYFSMNLPDDTIIIASSGVKERWQIEEYLNAGADYVVFCGALECENWRPVLKKLAGRTIHQNTVETF